MSGLEVDRVAVLGEVRRVLSEQGYSDPPVWIEWDAGAPPSEIRVPTSETNCNYPSARELHFAFLVAGAAQSCLACFTNGTGERCGHPLTPPRAFDAE